MKYLLDIVSLMRDSLKSEVDYSKFLPWKLDKITRKELAVESMSIKFKKF